MSPVNASTRLLVVEDDRTIGEPLVEALAREGFTVRWVETVRYLEGQGVARLVECAPGKVLVGLAKRTAPGLQLAAITDSAALAAALA